VENKEGTKSKENGSVGRKQERRKKIMREVRNKVR